MNSPARRYQREYQLVRTACHHALLRFMTAK